MPGGDRTGPLGLGARTGRAGGYCAGFGAPGYMNQVPGFEYGPGRGQGAGFGPAGDRGAFRGRRLGRSFSGGYQYSAPAYIPILSKFLLHLSDKQLSLMEKRLAELEVLKKSKD